MSDMTACDYAVMSNNGIGNGMNGMWNNPFMYLIWLALLGGNGLWGGNNRNSNDATTQGELTRSDLAEGFANQDLRSDIRSNYDATIDNGSTIQSVGNNLTQAMNSGFNGVNSAINTASYNNQLGMCGIERNIDSLKYEMAQNCCGIKTAIHEDGEATRALITANTIQDLRDKLAIKDNELQSAQLTLANANQTQNILTTLGRFVPYQGCGSICGCTGF